MVLDYGPITACIPSLLFRIVGTASSRHALVSIGQQHRRFAIRSIRNAAEGSRNGTGFLWSGLWPPKLVSVIQTPRYRGQSYRKLITAHPPIEPKTPKRGCLRVPSPHTRPISNHLSTPTGMLQPKIRAPSWDRIQQKPPALHCAAYKRPY